MSSGAKLHPHLPLRITGLVFAKVRTWHPMEDHHSGGPGKLQEKKILWSNKFGRALLKQQRKIARAFHVLTHVNGQDEKSNMSLLI